MDWDGTLTVAEVRVYFEVAKAQLWCVDVAGEVVGLWVTRLEKSKRCTWGFVWGCAGDLGSYKDEAIRLFDITKDWFRANGCEFVEWSGRAGWQRIFPDFDIHAVVMRQKL